MIRAVVDTNVIVSGLYNRSGTPAKIVDMILEGKIFPIVTENTYVEMERVINYPKFELNPGLKDEVLLLLKSRKLEIPAAIADIRGVPIDDLEFVRAAVQFEADCLITGNIRHFSAVSAIVNAVTPAEFISKYGKRNI